MQVSASHVPVTVVFASDGGYVPFLLVAVSSVLRHMEAGRPCTIVVMAAKFLPFHRRALEQLVSQYPSASLNIIDVTFLDARLNDMFERRGKRGEVTSWSYTTYYRLFIGTLLADCPRAVYLDVDTLAFGDVAALFDWDLDGATVASVDDVCLIHAPESESTRAALRRNGHDVARYFNAGVMVIDLDQWRRERIEEKIEDEFLQLEDLLFPDQDILNRLFCNDRAALPGRWNFLTCRLLDQGLPQALNDETSEIIRAGKPGIAHYVGGKPWGRCGESPLAHFWWEEAARVRALFEGDPEAVHLQERLTRRSSMGRILSLSCQYVWFGVKEMLARGMQEKRYRERRARMRVHLAELLRYTR